MGGSIKGLSKMIPERSPSPVRKGQTPDGDQDFEEYSDGNIEDDVDLE